MNIAGQLMKDHINAGGYLRGNRTLDVKPIDTSCSGAHGRSEAAKLILLPREDWPFGIIGCGCSGCTISATPLLNLARMPIISASATSTKLSDRALFPNYFRISSPDQVSLRSLFILFRALKWTAHAQVYDPGYGLFTVPWAAQTADDLGMVNVFAGRSIGEMRSLSVDDALPIVDALVQARVRGVLYFGYSSWQWPLGCAMSKRKVHGMIVGNTAKPFLVTDDACTPAEMDLTMQHWIAGLVPKLAEPGSEVECLAPGSTLEAFLEEYERQLNELGATPGGFEGHVADTVCLFAKIFNTLLDMGFTESEVHNMNESTYATYSSLVQGISMRGVSGHISFPSDPTAYGAGDRISETYVLQRQGSTYVRIGKLEGDELTMSGFESTMSFFGGYSLAEPPAALFPACTLSVYNFFNEQCEGCPFGSDFIETEGSCFCSPGFHINGTVCSPCAEGSFSGGFGSSTCELCAAGMFAGSSGLTDCERCPLGTFMPRLGGAECEPCGVRSTTLERGADDAALCVCEEGSFLSNDTRSCEVCSEGLLCAAGLSPPLQLPGYWAELRELTHEHEVWRCRNLRECNGGAVGECAAGRQGRCCNDCISSHRPSDDGTCKPCDSWDLLPAVITGIVALFVLIVLLVLVRVDVNKDNLELVGITVMATQLCMLLQMLGVLAQIQVKWVDPAKAILDSFRFLMLDLDVIHGDCWLPSSDPVSKFTFQLIAFPIWACTVLLAWAVSHYTRTPLSSTDVFSLLGTVLFMLFITLTLTVLLPFQCRTNPSGRTSMAAHPGMVCYESTEHWTLVVMATVGFIVYPATCLTWATWATMKYPAWISSGYGLQMVQKYRFLFGRFRAEHYYFGLFVLFRNGLMALLPVVLVSVEAAQIVILCVVLVCSSLYVAHTSPWRTPLANRADVLMLFCTAVFLNGISMLVQVTEETELSVGWLLYWLMMLPLALGVVCIAWGIWKNFNRRRRYEVFLSHHKAGAGALARFVKLELAKVGVCNAFLDVDSLENLDSLFHIVRWQTRNMVVLLSSETLKRMWCAGEIVTAHRNGVHTVPVLCDGFRRIDGLALKTMVDTWTAAELQALLALGISWDMTEAAYVWLQQLPCVELRRFGSEAEHSRSVQNIVKLCSRIKAAPQPKTPAVSRPEILITGAVSNPEALSTCQVLRIMLQRAMRVEAVVVRTHLELQQAQGSATFLVVVLTRGVLLDEHFAETLVAANKSSSAWAMQVGATGTMKSVPSVNAMKSVRSGNANGLTSVTVNADAGFEFPSKDFYDRLRRDGFGGTNTESLISAYQSLLRILALPFSPLGSVNVQENEVSEICRRRFRGVTSCRPMSSMDSQPRFTRMFSPGRRRTSQPDGAEDDDYDQFCVPEEGASSAVAEQGIRHKAVTDVRP